MKPQTARRTRCGCALVLCAVLAAVGCQSSQWVTVRDTPRNPLAGTLDLVSPGGPKPTKRTMQLLRRYDLLDDLKGDRAALLARLADIERREPNREHDYAMAEIAYITAKEAETLSRDRALQFYGTALVHAYRYLFGQGAGGREQGVEIPNPLLPAPCSLPNPYDPQFRGASDLYNQSLEGMLRLMRGDGEVRPGMSRVVKTANHTCSFDVVVHSSDWHADDFDRFEFVSDYRVKGLTNHYRSYGLGVPLIAVRRSHEGQSAAEDFYPPSVCFPVTAFLRVLNREDASGRIVTAQDPGPDHGAPRFVLELYDPLDRDTIQVAGRDVPLESDLSTPLAFFLQQPQFQDSDLSALGLFRPGDAKDLQGLYMLEPYDPTKMPVVMVHGLYSSPITWMEMYNDLRSDPLVRQHYQFWFYMYPTGQPFWFSATQMREDLALMRRKLDPAREAPALDHMVLVGHSMGGLVSKLQTVDSDDEFWRTMSDRPFGELEAEEEVVQSLASTFFFQPSPSVRRVVTLGTPHRGSEFSNGVTRWLGTKLIDLPTRMMRRREELLARNRDFFLPGAPLEIHTSIDSLAPDSPVLPVLLTASPGPWVAYHNVVGRDPDPGWEAYLVGAGDGVVSLASAQLDGMAQLRSQIIVSADHMSVHRHPQSILEVRRILVEQLAELQNFPNGRGDGAEIAEAGAMAPASQAIFRSPNGDSTSVR